MNHIALARRLTVFVVLALGALARAADAPVVAPSGDTTAPAQPTFVIGKWKTTLYGFAETDAIRDSTQSFADLQGAGIIGKPGTAAGDNSRFQLSVRNSRLGFRLEAPETHGVKASALAEMDFYGYDPAPYAANSEAGFFNNPTFRLRHFWVKVESPWLDVLAGQSWELFGWQPYFQPATAAVQGVPGEVYARTAQVRLGKVLHLGDTLLEVQAAALRPPERDTGLPDLQAGARFEFSGWTGFKSTGGAVTGASALSFGVSALYRKLRLAPAMPASTSDFNVATGSALAVDALVPILRGSKTSRAGAVTLVAEFTRGSGYADLFTGLTGGAAALAPPGATDKYAPDLDAGLAGYATDTGTFTTVDWQTAIASLQIFTPVQDGALWLSLAASDTRSDNVQQFNKAGATCTAMRWYSVSVFYDLTPAVRFALDEALVAQQMSDQTTRQNLRTQLSAYFIF